MCVDDSVCILHNTDHIEGNVDVAYGGVIHANKQLEKGVQLKVCGPSHCFHYDYFFMTVCSVWDTAILANGY